MVLWAGGWASKFFHSDLTCGVTALKPCTQTWVCGACARSLGAYVPGSGHLQAPHCFFLFPFSVAGSSFYVVREAYSVMYDR